MRSLLYSEDEPKALTSVANCTAAVLNLLRLYRKHNYIVVVSKRHATFTAKAHSLVDVDVVSICKIGQDAKFIHVDN